VGNPLDVVLKLLEARGSGKWLIKVFEDWKSSEIFLMSSRSFGKQERICRAHKTCGRITTTSFQS